MAAHHDTSVHFSPNGDEDFEIRSAIGVGTGIGEILAATKGLRGSDHEGWFTAWHDLAERTLGIADAAAAAGHRVSAADAYLRASGYYGVALNAMSALEDASGLAALFGKGRAAWDAFVAHGPTRAERIDIPYGVSSLPGYFFRPAKGLATGRTLVVANGSDGALASLWAMAADPALARGYNVLLFDGPGQQSQLFERNVPFRPDWEAVLTPVYDDVSRRHDVDPARIGLYGISQGGYWVARALAFEHRYAAAIVDPGVVDVSSSWTRHIPGSLLKLLDAGQNEKFDKEMRLGMAFSGATARTWQFRARPYGAAGYAETIEAVRTYTVADLASRIMTPLLITSPEGEQFWPGQSEQLASLTPNVSILVPFTAAEGADGHCQPLARDLTAQRVFDWMDDMLSA
ncbi:MAG: prolyl oligopeptidase family serine peptidase [Proteobacteria bacterium]|nr:prolyl oligopeptidase family serine peptidase [Pseudomonadota bacterium]